MTEWKEVPGFANYLISDSGEVCNAKTQRLLKPETLRSGHKRVDLRFKTNRYREFVHRLVVKTFVGEIPAHLVVEHLDGNPANNNVENLKISTQLENILRKRQHGTEPTGEVHWRSKFTNEEYKEIEGSELTSKELALKFNSSKSTMDAIRYRKRKRDIPHGKES